MKTKKINELTSDQQEILESFIKQFLPKRGNKRKNSGNEIDYITTTLNKVFIKDFGFNISRKNILDTFAKLNYDIFNKNGEWKPDVKDYKPSKSGNSIRFDEGYSDYNASFIYVDISPSIFRQLMLTIFTPPPHTKKEKIIGTEEMKKQIELFKRTIKRN
jgi:hypothetical protein